MINNRLGGCSLITELISEVDACLPTKTFSYSIFHLTINDTVIITVVGESGFLRPTLLLKMWQRKGSPLKISAPLAPPCGQYEYTLCGLKQQQPAVCSHYSGPL